ncbi:MAG: AMP-binding protein [Bdellovibrionales bacterium]
MEKIWLKNYPKGVPHEINADRYKSITELFEQSCQRWQDRAAFTNMGAELSYSDLNDLSTDFASYLQNVAGLKKGDRIAIQMPNVLQYPVVLYGALRAGLVVVNTNPLYTAREMKHQFKDSGAKAIVILETCAHLLQEILPETDIKTVVVTSVGDMLGFPKSFLVNAVIRHVKKMVPDYKLPGSFSFWQAMDLGASKAFQPVETSLSDLAFLQYTGGTTGISKGAMLTHRNVIANMLQILEWMKTALKEGQETVVLALPLYHIFSLTVNGLGMMSFGGTNLMITNPRDIPGFIKTLRKNRVTVFVGLNTLLNGLMNNPDFNKIDFSSYKITVCGGMALQKAVALRWKELTKCRVVEGYGLTETSPVVSCNPIDGTDKVGTIGLPLPSTEIKLCDDNGKEVAPGESGEICVRGPQVMRGYWQQPSETEKIMLPDNWIKTGDVAQIDPEGYLKIVDRKKDMILVSGFNVYPNEIEDVIATHPKVLEVAAVGVPDARSTEVVKVFIVAKDPSLTPQEIIQYCEKNLTGYKVPRFVELRKELPKTNVGKILRRALRDEPNASKTV